MPLDHAGYFGTDSFTRQNGRPVPAGTPVTVYDAGTTDLAVLYTDRDRSAVAANPSTVPALGNFSFFAEAAEYDVLIGETTVRVVAHPDPRDIADGPVITVNGLPGPNVTLTYIDVAADAAGSAAAVSGALAGDLAAVSGSLAPVATSGDYNDLSNKPTIPPAAPVDSVNGETGVVVLDAGDVGADPAGSAAAVAGDLATHEGLTTTAHGGVVASTDPRLTDARTPTAHEASHHHDGSDPLSAGDVGADPAGTAAALVAALPSFTAGRGIDITEVTPGVMEVGFDNISVVQYAPGTTTITVPSWARMAYVTCIGGGGGGGGGRRGATSTVRGGGGGGQGGHVVSGWVRAASISTTVTVGAGGTAGAGGASDSTSGANGGDGGTTAIYFGVAAALMSANGGQGGRGGTNTDGGQGGGLVPVFGSMYWPPAPGSGMPGSKGGGATTTLPMISGRYVLTTADPNTTTAWLPLDAFARTLAAGVGGGGGGGGYTAANANSDPSTGVACPVLAASHGIGAAGTSGSKNGQAGTILLPSTTDLLLVGAGGGGGYQSSSGAAGNGGAGIGYGGPGGGGGASLNGNTAGSGGAGAGGLLQIIWVA